MKYKVVLISPDTHVQYSGRTPEEQGIGGGVTARVRMLRALARMGHEVTAYVHCDAPGIYEGVAYRPLQEAQSLEADVLIAITTGGDLDLSPLQEIPIRCRLKIVWIQGPFRIRGLEAFHPDFLYVASNFLRDVAVREWGFPAERIFVCYNGLEQDAFRTAEAAAVPRDPKALVYIGHPRKGLENALAIFRLLKARDPDFTLEILGGPEIWGQSGALPPLPHGAFFRGLIPQRELPFQLMRYGFCLAIQDFPEGFGIALQECKRAGVAVIASPVGAIPELIQDGYDGFLIEGAPTAAETHERAAERILRLLEEPEYLEFVRRNAMRTPWDWEQAAQAWTAHWDLVLHGQRAEAPFGPVRYACPECQVALHPFPDGWRCLRCATFTPIVDGILRFARDSGSYSEIHEPYFHRMLGKAIQRPWREAVVQSLGPENAFLIRYILDESRGFFHFLFDLGPDALVLDVGAGFGAVASAVARRCRVVALDNHILRLAFLRERARQEGLEGITLVHADALSLPFEAEQFDLVLLIGVLEWAGTWRSEGAPEDLQLHLLREVHRVLKRGGNVAIGIENRYGARYLLGEPDDHTQISGITYLPRDEADQLSRTLKGVPYRVRTHSAQDYEALLRQAGFRSVAFYAPYPDYRLWSALIPLEDAQLLRFFLREIEVGTTAMGRLERAFAEIGLGREFVNAYLIVGGK
jgi:glycosyltransferase involved in cell wall biosynthesis/ubiquinone/menaquinone biosynthesis C-methylase UbiE